MSKIAQDGHQVQVHYTGRLTDGSEFDSSRGNDPLAFTVGSGEVIPGFDAAVRGLTPGESRTVTIPADEAYGPVQPEMIAQVAQSDLPADLQVAVGQQLTVTQDDGHSFEVRVTALDNGIVTLDANHPLAGQDLTFDIELVAII